MNTTIKETIRFELNDLNKKSLDEAVLHIINERQLLLTEQAWLKKAFAWARNKYWEVGTGWVNLKMKFFYGLNPFYRIAGINPRKLTKEDIFPKAAAEKLKSKKVLPKEDAIEIAAKIRAHAEGYVPMIKFVEENAGVLNALYPKLFTPENLVTIRNILKAFQSHDAAVFTNPALMENWMKFLSQFDVKEFEPVMDDIFRMHIGPLPKDLADDFADPLLLTFPNKTQYLHGDDLNIKNPTTTDIQKIQTRNNPLNIKLKGDPEIVKLFDGGLQVMNNKGKWVDFHLSTQRMIDFNEALKLLDQGLVDPFNLIKWLNTNFGRFRRKNAPKNKEGEYHGKGGNPLFLGKPDYHHYDVTIAHEIAEHLHKKGMLPEAPKTYYDKNKKVYTTVTSPARINIKPLKPFDGSKIQKMKQNNPNNTRLVKPGFEGAPELTTYLRQYELGEVPPERLVSWVHNIPAPNNVKEAVIKKLEASGDIKILTPTASPIKIPVLKKGVSTDAILSPHKTTVSPPVIVLGTHKGFVVTKEKNMVKTINKSVNDLIKKLPKGNSKFDPTKVEIKQLSAIDKDGFQVLEIWLVDEKINFLMFKNNKGVNKDQWFVTPGIGYYKQTLKGTLQEPVQKLNLDHKWFIQNSKSKQVTTGGNDYMTELATWLKDGRYSENVSNIGGGKQINLDKLGGKAELPKFEPTRSSTAPESKYTPDYDPMPTFNLKQYRKHK